MRWRAAAPSAGRSITVLPPTGREVAEGNFYRPLAATGPQGQGGAQEVTTEAVASPQAGRDAGRRYWRHSQREAPPQSITLGKVAAGLCGDLLTCVLYAWDFVREEAGKRKKPVLLVPVMNTLIRRGGGVQWRRGADPVAVFLL